MVAGGDAGLGRIGARAPLRGSNARARPREALLPLRAAIVAVALSLEGDSNLHPTNRSWQRVELRMDDEDTPPTSQVRRFTFPSRLLRRL